VPTKKLVLLAGHLNHIQEQERNLGTAKRDSAVISPDDIQRKPYHFCETALGRTYCQMKCSYDCGRRE
jgi:hypothetical protein